MKPDDDEMRRQRSDEARRAAIKQRIIDQKERSRQIANDIANVDKKAAKRVVFEDSDETDAEDGQKNDKEKKPSSSSSKRPRLFDSDDENEEEDTEQFTIKNRHSGEKGEKLMQMEARFNSDPRFKLDDKFAESDSGDNSESETENAEKQEMKLEKDKNRELLSKILGKSVEQKKPRTTETGIPKARPFTRFDPENLEHVAWMKEFEAFKNPLKTRKRAETENVSSDPGEDYNEEGDELSTQKDDEVGDRKNANDSGNDGSNFEKADIFFKIDETFSAEMKLRKDNEEPSSGNFSFLSMIGRKYNNEPVVNEDVDISVPKIGIEKVLEKPAESAEKINKVARPFPKVGINSKFFVDPLVDDKIKSLAVNFRRTQAVEKVIDKWAPHRDAIFKLWKKQRREAVKKQKDFLFSDGNRKRRNEKDIT